MTFEKVTSSQIHSIAHDPETQELHVRFRCSKCAGEGHPEGSEFACDRCGGSGVSSHYRYFGVGSDIHGAVKGAESVGSAFHQHIKKGGYEFEKVKA